MSFAKFAQSLLLLFVGMATLIAGSPAQAQTETVLYNFNSTDGDNPTAGLTSDGKGNFYGATPLGGDFGNGTVFELSPNGGGGWNETVLHSFAGADGSYAYANVIFDNLGNLYGTTLGGGVSGRGVVFELSPRGGSWTETVLYSPTKGQVGSYPQTGLIMDPAGNLYGATLRDVFELSPSGGDWTARKICSVAALDAIVAGLTIDAAGNIFGNSIATVFELTPNGKGGWLKHVIHKFAGIPNDGAVAEGIPVLDQAGNLYGTTYAGGLVGYGTVYEMSPEKHGKWTERILYSFVGGSSGYSPSGGIVFDAAGNIYGTTNQGGTSSAGTVFELAPVGDGSYSEQVLWSFNGTDGEYPVLRQTIRKRLQTKLNAVKAELRRRMHEPIPEQGKWLRGVVSGHFRYYGVPMNQPALALFRFRVVWYWHRSLSRRSQNGHVLWDRMRRLITRWLPLPSVYHPYPLRRMGVIT